MHTLFSTTRLQWLSFARFYRAARKREIALQRRDAGIAAIVTPPMRSPRTIVDWGAGGTIRGAITTKGARRVAFTVAGKGSPEASPPIAED